MTSACKPYNLGGSVTMMTTTKNNKNTQASQSIVSPRIQLTNAMPMDKSMSLKVFCKSTRARESWGRLFSACKGWTKCFNVPRELPYRGEGRKWPLGLSYHNTGHWWSHRQPPTVTNLSCQRLPIVPVPLVSHGCWRSHRTSGRFDRHLHIEMRKLAQPLFQSDVRSGGPPNICLVGFSQNRPKTCSLDSLSNGTRSGAHQARTWPVKLKEACSHAWSPLAVRLGG
jgi:hypothetical protein